MTIKSFVIPRSALIRHFRLHGGSFMQLAPEGRISVEIDLPDPVCIEMHGEENIEIKITNK